MGGVAVMVVIFSCGVVIVPAVFISAPRVGEGGKGEEKGKR